jgi:hypothetical protein
MNYPRGVSSFKSQFDSKYYAVIASSEYGLCFVDISDINVIIKYTSFNLSI